MRILFLDDDSYRYKQILRARGYNTTIDWVETAQACIDKLSHHDMYNQIWLDHDLGGEVYVSETNINTGSEVVRHILREELPIKCDIIVHSMNTVAANNMVAVLQKAGYSAVYMPFSLAKKFWDETH